MRDAAELWRKLRDRRLTDVIDDPHDDSKLTLVFDQAIAVTFEAGGSYCDDFWLEWKVGSYR